MNDSVTLPSLKDLLKDNTVQFSRYHKGHLYYTIASHEQETNDGYCTRPRYY